MYYYVFVLNKGKEMLWLKSDSYFASVSWEDLFLGPNFCIQRQDLSVNSDGVFLYEISLLLPPSLLFEALQRNVASFILSFHCENPKSKPVSDLAATLSNKVSKTKCNKR